MNVIEARNMTKIFHTKSGDFLAVEDISFTVEQNDFVSFVGPSGCGKSTIIRMLDGIIPFTEGSVKINGEKFKRRVNGDVIRKMGFVFQSPNLLPWLSVRANLELPLKVFKMKEPLYLKHLKKLAESFGLGDYMEVYPSDLSGGMVQRAGVLRAMVHKPEILLMDEPYGSLDEDMREQLDLETLSIWEETGVSIIFITHNITEAILLSKKVVVMGTNPGHIVKEIPIELPYPRTLAMIKSEKFAQYEQEIVKLIGILDLSQIV